MEPERSDFEYGLETWRLMDSGQGTRVRYTHELKTRFWVPPLIGVWAIRRELKADALKAGQRIEQMALRKAAGDSP